MLNDQKPIVDAMQLDPGIFVLLLLLIFSLVILFSVLYSGKLRYKDNSKTTAKCDFTTCKAYVG